MESQRLKLCTGHQHDWTADQFDWGNVLQPDAHYKLTLAEKRNIRRLSKKNYKPRFGSKESSPLSAW